MKNNTELELNEQKSLDKNVLVENEKKVSTTDETKEKIIQDILNAGSNMLYRVEVPDEYKKDMDVAMVIAKLNGFALSKMDPVTYNRQVIVEALKSNRNSEKYIPKELFDDKDIVLTIVKNNGHLLWKASDRLIDDEDVVLAAIQNDPTAIKFASDRLKNSEIMKEKLKDLHEKEKIENDRRKNELIAKIEEFKNKPIWCQDEKVVDSIKLSNEITSAIIEKAQTDLGFKLPKSYIDLLTTQNGGRLIKRYTYLPKYHNEKVFEIDGIFGISDNLSKGIVQENSYGYIELNKCIFFGRDDSGHGYYLFDYENVIDTEEPKIMYYDDELDCKIELASNFKEFVDNLKIHEEVDLIYW